MRAAAVGLLLLLSGCGSASGAPGADAPTPARGTTASVSSLIGAWFVTAEGEDRHVALRLADGQLELFRPCGVMGGSWAADGPQQLFAAGVSSGDGACFAHRDHPTDIAWLDAAAGYRADGDDRQLIDATGAVVATLKPGATPTTGPNSLDEGQPTLSPALQEKLDAAEPAPLPSGTAAATEGTIAARWVPTKEAYINPTAVAEFTASGRWSATPGCNGLGGRYVLGEAGRLLTTYGPSTLVGCQGTPIDQWITHAARVGVRDGELVFYDAQGTLLGHCAKKT